MTQPAFSRVAWIAPWMTKPAAFGSYPPLSPITFPSRSILMRLDAVISSNPSPSGLTRK